MRKSLLLLGLFLGAAPLLVAQTLPLQVFNQANTPALTTDVFSTIEVTTKGQVWAGSLGNGLYSLDTSAPTPQWTKSALLPTHNIRDLKPDANGGVWVAQSGTASSGVQALTGGVDYIARNGNSTYYGALFGGMLTRAGRSLFVASSQTVWVANGATTTGGVPDKGGYSVKAPAETAFKGISNKNIVAGEDGPCYAIGGSRTSDVVWVGEALSCTTGAGCEAPHIIRIENGAYVGTYGSSAGLPVTTAATSPVIRAIHFAAKGRAWVGLSAQGIYYFSNINQKFLPVGAVLPAGTAVNFNGIKDDDEGNVYFCTTQGLLRFSAGQDPALAASYQLYTTQNGLPTNNITGIAFDPDTQGKWLATSAGLVRWLAEIAVKDPNPLMVNADGSLTTSLTKLPDLPDRIGAAADGLTKLLLVVRANRPLTFAVPDATHGTLSTLLSQAPTATSVTVAPAAPLDGQGYGQVVALYTAPDGLGATAPPSGRTATITVTDAGAGPGATGREVPLKLLPPPVVLVHGMWSNPDVWRGEDGFIQFLRGKGYKIPDNQLADYQANSAATFNPLTPGAGVKAVATAVTAALENYHQLHLACAQVDVVAHSLGGLMTRSFAKQADYAVPANFSKGSVHRLITLGTPHFGSPFGPLLYDRQADVVRLPDDSQGPGPLFNSTTLHALFALAKKPIGECHKDFGATSVALHNLNAAPTNIPTHAIAASIRPDKPILYYGLSAALAVQFGKTHDQVFADATATDGVADNDAIVAVTSQFGGLAAAARSGPYPSTAHSGPWASLTETNSPDIQQEVFSLLLMRGGAAFENDAQAPLPAQFAGGGARPKTAAASLNRASVTATDNIRITAPTRGAVLTGTAGTTLTLALEPSAGLVLTGAAFEIQGIGPVALPQTAPFSATLTLPAGTPLGRLHLVAYARDAAGTVFADTSYLVVRPGGPLQAIRVAPDSIVLDSVVRQRGLFVRSSYFNGQDSVQVNLSAAGTGTRYQVATGRDVATVDAGGVVTALKPGKGVVHVTYGATTIAVPVRVRPDFAAARHRPNRIEFAPIPNQLSGTILGLAASATSGEAVGFTVVSGPATLSADVLTVTGAGQVTIQAEQPGNSYYAPAPAVRRSFSASVVTATAASQLADLSLFPNPAHTNLVIELPAGTTARSVTLFDVQGRVVLRRALSANATQVALEVGQLANGVYLVAVQLAQTIIHQRFVKK